MKKQIIKFACIIMLISTLLLDKTTVFASEAELNLHAKAALLLDADNNRVLYEKNGYEVMAMASTTKIMTCILALEYGNPDEEVEVTSYAASMPKVRLGMQQGDSFLLKDLLYSLMLESHNDTAVAIAEHIGNSVEGFAGMMNQKAKKLGCENTYFITPNGLDATKDGKSHSTTAKDLAVIASYAIRNEDFLSVVQTREHAFTNKKGTRNYHVNNKNRFLDMMKGAIGIKTGFTCEAGYCFVGALKKDGKTFVSVVLGCGWPPNKSWKWADTKKLMEYGLHNYNQKDIYNGKQFGNLMVEDGIAEAVGTKKQERSIMLQLSADDKIKTKYRMPSIVHAPVKKGDILGYEEYFVNDELYDKVAIVATEDVGLRDFVYCFREMIKQYFLSM